MSPDRPALRARTQALLAPALCLLLGALAGCGDPPGESPDPVAGPGGPPLPERLDVLDPRVVRRIEAARAPFGSGESVGSEEWGSLAMVYDAERLRQLALECYAEAERLDPGEPRWPYLTSICHSKMGREDLALTALERAIAVDPDHAPAHWRLGSMGLMLGDLERAQASFLRATELDPTFPGGWTGQARVHTQRDETEEALRILRTLIGVRPRDPVVVRLLVSAYRDAGLEVDFETEGLLEGEPPAWPDAWLAEFRGNIQTPRMQRVGVLLDGGRGAEALALLGEIADELEDDFQLLPQTGEAYYQLKRYDEALAVQRRILEREPDDIAARLAMARIYEARGETGKVLLTFDEVLELRPNYGPAHLLKGKLLYRNQQYEAALEPLRRAISLDERSGSARTALAGSLLSLRRFEEAVTEYLPLLEVEPERGTDWANLAKAYTRLGRLDEAEEALAQARANGARKVYVDNVQKIYDTRREREERRAARKREQEEQR